MKLREFLKNLNDIVEKNPKVLDLDVVTSIDDEGNGFNKVEFKPAIGCLEDDDFISEEQYSDYNYSFNDTNSICVN